MIDVSNYSTIQEALDSVPIVGGILYFPAGIYDINETLIIPDYVTVVGEGRGTILRSNVETTIEIPGSNVSVMNLSFEHIDPDATHRACIKITGAENYHFEKLYFYSPVPSTRPYLDRAIWGVSHTDNLTINDCVSDGLHFEPLIGGGGCHRYHSILVENTIWWGFDITAAGASTIVKNVFATDIQIMNQKEGGLYVGARQHGYGNPPAVYEMVRVSGVQVAGQWAGDGSTPPQPHGAACSIAPAAIMEDVIIEGLIACGAGGAQAKTGLKCETPAAPSNFVRCRVDARNLSNFTRWTVKNSESYPELEIQL